MQGSALEGVRVIDLCERIGGAYCGLLFATYGAEVILVEPPKGNALRRRGARVEGQGGRGESVSALWYLQGRKSVQLDLESEAGRREFRDLVKSADIILESFLPGKMEQLGLGMETLKGWKPDIVLLSLTDFGQTGPYRAFQAEEATIEALSGQMFGTGSPEREPLSSGPPIAQMTGGLHGFLGGQLALRLRNADGCARHVDVSHHEAGVENMELRAYAQWTAKGNPTREEFAHSALVPWGIYPCQDGWAAMHGAPFRRWRSFGRLLRGGNLLVWLYERGVEKMEQSESAKAGSLSGRNKKLRQLFLRYLDRATHQWTKERSRAEILQVGRERGLAFGSLRRLEEVLSLPQHRARDFFQEVTHPTSGRYEACRALFPMEGLQAMRAPVPGEHQDLLASLSTDEEVEAEPLSEPKPKGALPLEGIRVLDLTVVEAAPHGARVLADYGAEVLLVEYPGRLDLFRGTSLQRESYNRQPFWSQLHRNKRSLTLDLKSAKGREALLDLVETADVVLTSFRSGTLERLHLGYEELKRRKEDLIFVSVSGYGGGGPDSVRPAYGGVLEAMSGVQNLTSYPGGKPERIREIDVLNGVAAAAAVITAIAARDRTGKGQMIDASQLETTTHALMGEVLLGKSLGVSVVPGEEMEFHGTFPCDGEDQWVTLTLREKEEWEALAEVVQAPLGERWRAGRRMVVREALSEWTKKRSPREAMEQLQEVGLAAGAIMGLAEVLADPHLAARKWFQWEEGRCYLGAPFQCSDLELPLPRRGPDLGEANADFLPKELRDVPERELATAFRLDPDDRVKARGPEMRPGRNDAATR